MSGEVLHFTQSAHQRAAELLPWFLTGTLEADEQELVDRHLPACPSCRDELEAQRALQRAVIVSDPAMDHRAALERLLRRMDALPARPTGMPAKGLRRVLGFDVPTPTWARFALALQLGAVVALGWTLHLTDLDVGAYHTLSAAAVSPTDRGNLVVAFDPATPLRVVQSILVTSRTRIVDGPLVSGAYVLQAPQADLPATIAKLRTQRGVALVEPLVGKAVR